jgi:hypothetical protein
LSGRWTAGSNEYETQNKMTSAPEVAPAGMVTDHHGPDLMDPSTVKRKKIILKERKWPRAGGF